MERPEFHQPSLILSDPFRIGQTKCAEILADVSRQAMHQAAPRAFRNLDCPEWDRDMIAKAAMGSIQYHARLERQARIIIEREAR